MSQFGPYQQHKYSKQPFTPINPSGTPAAQATGVLAGVRQGELNRAHQAAMQQRELNQQNAQFEAQMAAEEEKFEWTREQAAAEERRVKQMQENRRRAREAMALRIKARKTDILNETTDMDAQLKELDEEYGAQEEKSVLLNELQLGVRAMLDPNEGALMKEVRKNAMEVLSGRRRIVEASLGRAATAALGAIRESASLGSTSMLLPNQPGELVEAVPGRLKSIVGGIIGGASPNPGMRAVAARNMARSLSGDPPSVQDPEGVIDRVSLAVGRELSGGDETRATRIAEFLGAALRAATTDEDDAAHRQTIRDTYEKLTKEPGADGRGVSPEVLYAAVVAISDLSAGFSGVMGKLGTSAEGRTLAAELEPHAEEAARYLAGLGAPQQAFFSKMRLASDIVGLSLSEAVDPETGKPREGLTNPWTALDDPSPKFEAGLRTALVHIASDPSVEPEHLDNLMKDLDEGMRDVVIDAFMTMRPQVMEMLMSPRMAPLLTKYRDDFSRWADPAGSSDGRDFAASIGDLQQLVGDLYQSTEGAKKRIRGKEGGLRTRYDKLQAQNLGLPSGQDLGGLLMEMVESGDPLDSDLLDLLLSGE